MALELDQIRSAAERVAASHGLEIVDVDFLGAGKARAAQDTTGLPSGVPVEALSGVTHEDCAVFAQDFGTLLDVEELVPGSAEYVLEVSSPGIERRLYREADWQRFQGFLVTVKLFSPVNGSRLLTGRMSFSDGVVTLDLSAVKGKGKRKKGVEGPPERVSIPLTGIEKANLIAEI